MGKRKQPKGFSRSPKEWEQSIAGHLGKIIDKMTVTDIFNILVFGSTAFVTYEGLEAASKELPYWDFLQYLAPFSPFLYQWKAVQTGAKNLRFEHKVALSLMSGYGSIKLLQGLTSTMKQEDQPEKPWWMSILPLG